MKANEIRSEITRIVKSHSYYPVNDDILNSQIDEFIENLNIEKEESFCMPDDINSQEEHEEYLKAIGYKK